MLVHFETAIEWFSLPINVDYWAEIFLLSFHTSMKYLAIFCFFGNILNVSLPAWYFSLDRYSASKSEAESSVQSSDPLRISSSRWAANLQTAQESLISCLGY